MITKFQALVARESMADCWSSDGQTVIVTAIKTVRGGEWFVEITFSDLSSRWAAPAAVTPSKEVQRLIENDTYCEKSMTHRGYKGLITRLSY